MTSTVHRRELAPAKPLSIRARHAARVAAQYPQPPAQPILDQLTPNADPRPFLNQVRQSLDGNLLRYSERLQLLRSARRHGIGRFEANLLIAIVQHRAAPIAAIRPAAPTRRSSHRALKIIAATATILASEYWLVHMALRAMLGA